MAKLKSEQHHWWPRCVSRYWAAEDGATGWIKPDGTVTRVPPHRLGMIGNGHHVKLGPALGDPTGWDFTFEREFDAADSNFPSVIAWLDSLERKALHGGSLRDQCIPQPATDERLRALTESVVSLAVRAPMNREASVSVADHLRGNIPTAQRNALIGLNMRSSQRLIADAIGARAKFAVLFSTGKEFIYGDGFFHNVRAVINPPHHPKMLAPITPTMSVIIAKPMSYMVQPRLVTIVLDDAEVDACNHAIQVYSRDALFFRSEEPMLEETFKCRKHLIYSHPDNPIDRLIRAIPGVPPRDTSLDFLLDDRPT